MSQRHRIAAVVVAGYCAFLQLYATQPLLPLLTQVFHAGREAVSLTVTMASLGVAVAAPLAGILADKIGRRKVIVWSAFLLAVASLATASAANLPQLIAWRFLQGVFTPGIFAVTVAYINDEWRDAGAGRVVASYISGTVSGGFCGRVLSGLIASHSTWPHVFLLLGGLNLLLAVVIALWLPEERRRPGPAGEGFRWRAVAAHLGNGPLLATFSVGFCVLFSLVGVFTYVTFHLAAAPYSLSPVALGFIFFAYLAGVVATPMAGRSIDRFGHRTILTWAIAVSIAGVALSLAAPLWIIAAGLAVACMGVFSAQAAASAFIGVAAEHNRGLAVGLYATFYYLGGSAGAAAPEPFYSWGGWPACAAFIAAVQVLTIVIALRWWRPSVPRLDAA